MKTVFISAGEASGDLHAAALIEALKARCSGLRFFGLGGDLMRAQGVELLYDLRHLAVTGFWEVAKRIFHFRNVFKVTLSEIKRRKPDLVIFVDYPGFNLRMAQHCHRLGIKVVYYISPQVWAWKKGRIADIERDVDLLLTILPFEKELFDSAKLRCEFVGHPLLDLIDEAPEGEAFRTKYKIRSGEKIVALLPGSRENVVKNHYKTMLEAVKQVGAAGHNLRPFTAVRDELDPSLYEKPEIDLGIKPIHISEDRYALMKSADISVVSAGTATLETALCGNPFCIVYRTNWLNYQIAKRVIKLPGVGLANIVAGKTVAPEFLQHEFTPENVSRFFVDVLTKPDYMRSIKSDLGGVRSRLGDHGAARRAAELIVEGYLT